MLFLYFCPWEHAMCEQCGLGKELGKEHRIAREHSLAQSSVQNCYFQSCGTSWTLITRTASPCWAISQGYEMQRWETWHFWPSDFVSSNFLANSSRVWLLHDGSLDLGLCVAARMHIFHSQNTKLRSATYMHLIAAWQRATHRGRATDLRTATLHFRRFMKRAAQFWTGFIEFG